VIFSAWGKKLFADELSIRDLSPEALMPEFRVSNNMPPNARLPDDGPARLHIHHEKALDSPLASGSFLTDGMIICPCTSHTLGQVAAGIGDSLLTRAAAVTLKEGRRLIVVPREMPTSRIDLENMLRLSSAHAIVCPANPGFYMHPKTIGDLVDFIVGKLLDLMSVPHALNTRWKPE